jgi:cation/acetate symporter
VIYETSTIAVIVFAFFVGVVLCISLYLGSKTKSAKGYYAAHGQIHWFVNGVAFAGDYLSAASFLGICGMIAFYGYDGFLYSIGYLAGWVVALFVIAEPLKRLGRFTFADALDNRFNSRGIKLAAAISTLVISIFYLIPQMVGAGALIKPLLGMKDIVLRSPVLGITSISAHASGVFIVGGIVIMIVVTAGMVSTTYVQFIKGSLLVFCCMILTGMILQRGLSTEPIEGQRASFRYRPTPAEKIVEHEGIAVMPETEGWVGKPYIRIEPKGGGIVSVWRKIDAAGTMLSETQYVTVTKSGNKFVNGQTWGHGQGQSDLYPVGQVTKLPDGQTSTGPLGPLSYINTLSQSEVVLWGSDTIKEYGGAVTTVYYPKPTPGKDVLIPGASPTFKGVRSEKLTDKLDFISLMLALFCGTASLPHILIRYYTVKDQAAVRKSTVVGIAAIGFFYLLTLYLGLGAMTSGALDVTNSNMAAPLLARSFGELPFAIISAVAFTTVLGTVCGLIMAASGAVAHDLMETFFKIKMDDHAKVKAGKRAAVVVGIIAMALGIAFEKMNVTFLVGWAFNIAASANLPSLVMLLFWKRTTKQGITASIIVGMVSSLAWVLLSAQAYKDVYHLPPESAWMPFSQPGLVTIPLAFVVLVVVSLLTPRHVPAVQTAAV